MSFNCKYCGRELPDDAAFCEGCGATFDTDKITCLSCGERLDPGTTLCPACGARIYNTGIDEPAEMEALVPPVITDDMFGSERQDEPVDYAIESADESVYANRPVQPAPVPAAPAPTPVPAPAAIPAPPPVRPAEPIPVPIKAKPHAPAQVAPLLNRPRPIAAAAVPEADNSADEEPFVSNSSARFEEVARPEQPYDMMRQPGAYQEHDQAPHPTAPATMRVEGEKKKRSKLIPIILICLIVAVILVDVFVLFRDRIFGSDDSKASKSISVITVTESITDCAP